MTGKKGADRKGLNQGDTRGNSDPPVVLRYRRTVSEDDQSRSSRLEDQNRSSKILHFAGTKTC